MITLECHLVDIMTDTTSCMTADIAINEVKENDNQIINN